MSNPGPEASSSIVDFILSPFYGLYNYITNQIHSYNYPMPVLSALPMPTDAPQTAVATVDTATTVVNTATTAVDTATTTVDTATTAVETNVIGGTETNVASATHQLPVCENGKFLVNSSCVPPETTNYGASANPNAPLTNVKSPATAVPYTPQLAACGQGEILVNGSCTADYGATDLLASWLKDAYAYGAYAGSTIAGATASSIGSGVKMCGSILPEGLNQTFDAVAQSIEENPAATTLVLATTMMVGAGAIAYQKGFLPGFKKSQTKQPDSTSASTSSDLQETSTSTPTPLIRKPD